MNISEFERMISLADEKYVDEMFEDRIYGKRKNIFISFAAAAAALTVTIRLPGIRISTNPSCEGRFRSPKWNLLGGQRQPKAPSCPARQAMRRD